MQRIPVLAYLRRALTGLDRPLAILVFLLMCCGIITLYSAGADMPGRVEDQLRNMLVSFVLMWALANLPPQVLMRIAVPIYSIGVALLLAVALFGLVKKGARRWVNIGVVIQPSEIMKIAMPLMLSWYFQKREGQLKRLDFIIAGVLLLIPVGLIARQPDLGTALLVIASGMYVLYFAGLSWKLIIPTVSFIIIGVITLVASESIICQPDIDWIILHDYQKHRVCTLLDPSTDPLGKGFHTLQAMIAIGSGGIHGKGWMQGTQTHLEFLPEKHTDFIFAVFSEEFGLIGNICLLVLYLMLVWRGLAIAQQAGTLFSKLLAGSIAMIFFTYAFVNMGMVSGILPVVGVPLPFMSYGGTALVTQGIGIGILLSIARQKKRLKER